MTDWPGVRVGILGPLELADGSTRIALPARTERAVVVALAARGGRAVTRRALTTDVWGEQADGNGHQNLVVTISRLRNRLSEAMGPAARDLIETVPDGYRLAVDPGQIDLVRFEALVAEARERLDAGSPDVARERVIAALSLWRGDPFTEIADSPTGRAEALRLAEQRAAAVDLGNDASLALGDNDSVVAQLEVSLVDDPFREGRWAQLMTALYRSGRQADALRAYQRARAVLADELGIEPGPTLRRLEAAILGHEPTLDLDVARPAPVRRAPPVTMLPEGRLAWVHQQLEGPLVGRQDELARLRQHWEAVKAVHNGGVVFVEGDAGVGKTRLAAELAQLVLDEGGQVIAGRCEPNAGLTALVPTVADLGVELPDGDLSPGSPALVTLGYEVARQLVAAPRDIPTLVVLDDAHLIDEQTASLFARLGDRPLPMPMANAILAVVLVQRGFERPAAMPGWLRNVERLPVSDWIELEKLGLDESLDLVEGRLGDHHHDHDLGEAIVRAGGGNPRALVELARAAQTAGQVGADPDELPIPQSLRVAFDSRLDSQPVAVVELLLAAGVVGPTFTVAEAADAAAVAEDAALSALESAVAGRLIDEDPSVPGTYRFVLEVERRMALARLSAARRARVEARLQAEG